MGEHIENIAYVSYINYAPDQSGLILTPGNQGRKYNIMAYSRHADS
jgi:hypothetical protein